MGSNGVCFADKTTDELLREFQHGSGSVGGGGVGRNAGGAGSNGSWAAAAGNGTARSQAAFEEIVRRYAGMVYTVCLQVTRDVHDAEDATQAAFLTLALRAKTGDSAIKYLGPWLQKVARRLSLDIMRAKKRRQRREEKRGAMVRELQPDRDPRRGLDRAEMADIVRDELSKLPAKYRLPLILHYFGGLRPEEVARELGFKPSTLGVRLHRGRKMLAENLAQRGITLTNGMLATILAGVVHIGISDNVVASTSLAAAGLSTNGDFVGSIISARVLALTRQATNALVWAKAKSVLAALVISSAALAGTTQAIRAIAPDGLDWRMLDISRLVRPLLRTLLGRPQFSAAPAPPPRAPAGAPPVGASGGFALDWLPVAPQAIHVEPPPEPWGDGAGGVTLTLGPPPIVPFDTFDDDLLNTSSGGATIPLAHPGQQPQPAPVRSVSLSSMQLPSGPGTITPINRVTVTGFRYDYANRTIHHTHGLRQFDSLVLDSRNSAFDHYIMSGADARLEAVNLIVGDARKAHFRQDLGQVHVSGNLTLGNERRGAGRYDLGPGAELTARNQNVGASGIGDFHNNGGINRARNLQVALGPGSDGTYTLAGDASLITDRTDIGVGGNGNFIHNSGSHTVGTPTQPGTLRIGVEEGSQGRYVLSGGTLTGQNLIVGDEGDATFTQTGGILAVSDVQIATQPTATGVAHFYAGVVQLDAPAQVVVGGQGGKGTVVIGDRSGAPTFHEAPPNSGANIVVRPRATGTGLLRGSGEIEITGSVTNNGQIIADGYGKARELDLSRASHIINTIDNPEHNGRFGWFTSRGGKLVLPAIKVPGPRTSTWGEDPLDPIPDLVNSVRFTVRDVRSPGDAILSLIALDSPLLPEFPPDESFVGVWGFDRRGLEFGNGDLLVRYDDMLVRDLGGDETALRLWTYSDGWAMAPLDKLVYEPSLNLLWGPVDGNFRLFGVSLHALDGANPNTTIPEPAALGTILTITGAALLQRRRRRNTCPKSR